MRIPREVCLLQPFNAEHGIDSAGVQIEGPTPRIVCRAADRLGGDTPVEAAVRSMLDDVAHGARVVVLRADDEVTPAQAADILGVTRQFVDRLCADRVLAFRRLPGSRHRRIRVQDVIDVAAERPRTQNPIMNSVTSSSASSAAPASSAPSSTVF